MGKIPGALNLMKPMFPIPDATHDACHDAESDGYHARNVSVTRVPMPDYMQEQMPEMMPKVMDNLLPHMVKDVVPLVTDPMIDYLQGKDSAARLN